MHQRLHLSIPWVTGILTLIYLSDCLHEVAGSNGYAGPRKSRRNWQTCPGPAQTDPRITSRGDKCIAPLRLPSRMQRGHVPADGIFQCRPNRPSCIIVDRAAGRSSIHQAKSVETKEERNSECEIRSRPWLPPCTLRKNETPPFE